MSRAPFALLAETSGRVAASSSRLAKVRVLAECLAAVPPEDVAIAVLHLSGVLPQGRIGIGYRALQTAAAQPPAEAPVLEIATVDAMLESLADTKGAGSGARRAALLAQLFGAATEPEQDFLVRLLAGELRQGALDGIMIDSIALAAKLPAARVRGAAMYAPGLGRLAAVALAEGEAGLGQFRLRLFDPVVPMLAQTAADVGEALRELPQPVQFEWKMDGARIQVHKAGDEVRIYSRRLNEVTDAAPEVVEVVRALPARELVLDGEVIALQSNGRPHDFQATMKRFGRRLNVEQLRAELPLTAFFFDCLYHDGASIIDAAAAERFEVLRSAVGELTAPRIVSSDAAHADSFMKESLAAGHEGVVAKALNAPYEAGRRGASWLKVKSATTLDLVVLAAEWGHGRRHGWLSNLHLGARDPQNGGFVMLGKTFKGMTDEMLQWQTREFLARETHRDEWTVYVRPELIVEIAFDDIQSSPRYPGGLALRFARVKGYRPDKRLDEADTIDTVRALYQTRRST